MKVMLLIDSLVSGGMERRLVELVKGFDGYTDVQLHVVVFSDKIHYTEIYDYGIPVTILKREPKRNPKVFAQLYKLCKNWGPDLIHTWGTMSAVLAVPTSLLLRIKLINGFVVDASHNMKFNDTRLIRARLSFPFSKVIVGNSQAGLKAYGVSKNKRICIYNGFNSNRIASLEDIDLIRKKFNIKTKKVVGMVASFNERKDHKTLIKTGLQLLKKRRDITFLTVGHGENLAFCKAMVPKEFATHFIFAGEQKDVESIVNVFDIGVLMTNIQVHGEGISNAILEYMALEKPVVATRGGGTNEIVVDNQTGFLIEPESIPDLAEKLSILLDNPETAIQMGRKGKQRINEQFSIEKMITAYYELYQKLK